MVQLPNAEYVALVADRDPQATKAAELLEALIQCEKRLTLLINRDQHRLLDVVTRDLALAAITNAA
jgi:hypothetical protein